MNKKDLSWFFLLLLILAVNSAEVFFRKGQAILGLLSVMLGVIFFVFFLIFHLNEKRDSPGLSIKKKLIIIVSAILISRLLLNFFVPVKAKIDQEKIEIEINTLLKEQEESSKQIDELQQEEKIEEAAEKVEKIKENINKVLELNQALINNASKNQRESLLKRQEILETSLTIFNEIEKCISFYPDNMDSFNSCQKEIEGTIKTIIPNNKQ